MEIRPDYISKTVFHPSLCSGCGAPDVGGRSAGGRRSIGLRPKYLDPTLPVRELLAIVELFDAKLALAMAHQGLT